ncbi:MAG: LacI family DNA-binding transcriptional regulator [Solobacterium sp.]|nr:LacI family DNA-binding transcriptional regulator [Solobacterium sp.]
MAEKKVTFADIAQYTGFSKTTISRYFNHPDSLTLENQERIREALDALGYKENKLARIFARGRSEFVGIIVPNLSMHFYSNLLSKILDTTESSGYKFLVFNGDGDKEKERRCIQELLAYEIEGLIVISHTVKSEELHATGVPVVVIERECDHCSSVVSDNCNGAILATEKLIEDRCDILFHINADLQKNSPDYGRISGFRDTADRHGIPHREYLKNFGNRKDEIQPIMKEIFEDIETNYKGKRKGIFLSNDTITNVLINLILRRYNRLPDDYRIIGFDDSPISDEAVLPFSTIHQDTRRLADTAMAILVEQMENRKKRKPEPEEIVHKVIPVRLVERETTGDLPGKAGQP